MAETLARWQFGVVTVYHFFFVPITLGISIFVATLQTAWYRTGKAVYKQLTMFWGKIFVINFALGVVTGIVQEFQFGMNWSNYSRFVGDVFGAPLAMEGLVAFFMESTFIGLWMFGADRLSPKVHLATIWLAAIGTNISAYFILAANSWMQHPVGYRINEVTGRAELTSIFAVITNSTAVITFLHVIAAAFLTTGLFIVGISAWHLIRSHQVEAFSRAIRMGLVMSIVAAVGVGFSGHAQAQLMTNQQPMKMAAAEALWDTTGNAGFSLFAIGDVSEGRNKFNLEISNGLSVLAKNNPDAVVEGVNDLQAESVEKFGEGNYVPNVPVTYWTFRLMIGTGILSAIFAAWGLYRIRRESIDKPSLFLRVAPYMAAVPLVGNSVGWLFTEIGRQPWSVYGLLRTSDSISPGVSIGEVLTTFIGFTVLYGVLAVIELWLLLKTAKAGVMEISESEASQPATDLVLPTLVSY